MQDVDFFEGQRPLTKIVFLLNKRKTTIECTPWEEWKLIEPCPFTLRCGNSRQEKLTSRIGIEHTQRTSFESTIGSSLGQKGVAALESSLKTTIGEEIKFQFGTEQEQTFTFDSPQCGYKIVRLYQRVRALHIKYQDTRFWHRNAFELTVIQWLKSIYDATIAEPNDPSCNCKETPEKPREGTMARIVCGALTKLAVQWNDNQQLQFPDNPARLDSYFKWEKTVDGQLPIELIPDYLKFLARIDSGDSLSAQAWSESVRFPATPGFRSASEVNVELDDAFQLVQAVSGLEFDTVSS